MAYQVLARKWRPQDFSAVVGQQSVVTALRNAVVENRIAQAYLFSGIRGVGKTSVARIFAKALNCPERDGADPCNRCGACEEITRGADLDVIEVDAATYSKVEQVRELAESLRYGPARDRYKVVVIDEIHRLSRQAFDALLKIVEEPPPHLVFVFATTEVEAVPATILSRCQEFRFRRVPTATLSEHLRRICDGEQITASDAALRLVSRAGEGSVRDAVALLDQLATFGSGTVADEQASRILGGVGAAFHLGLLRAILAGDSGTVAGAARQLDGEGRDPRHVYAELLAYCRDALHLALGGDPATIDLPGDEAVALAELVADQRYETLLRLIHMLLSGEQAVRRSEQGALALEIALLRAAELPKLTRVEELLSGGGPSSEGPASGGPGGGGPSGDGEPAPKRRRPPAARSRSAPGADPDPAAARQAAAASEPANDPPEDRPKDRSKDPPNKAASRAAAPPDPPASAPNEPTGEAGSAGPPSAADRAAADAGAEDNGDQVRRFLDQVSLRRQPLAAHLADAEEVRFEDGRLKIVAPADDDWLPKALARENNRAVLEECLHAVWGERADWRLATGSAARAPRRQAPSEAAAAPPSHPAAEHPAVQAALDIFGGTIETIDNKTEG